MEQITKNEVAVIGALNAQLESVITERDRAAYNNRAEFRPKSVTLNPALASLFAHKSGGQHLLEKCHMTEHFRTATCSALKVGQPANKTVHKKNRLRLGYRPKILIGFSHCLSGFFALSLAAETPILMGSGCIPKFVVVTRKSVCTAVKSPNRGAAGFLAKTRAAGFLTKIEFYTNRKNVSGEIKSLDASIRNLLIQQGEINVKQGKNNTKIIPEISCFLYRIRGY